MAVDLLLSVATELEGALLCERLNVRLSAVARTISASWGETRHSRCEGGKPDTLYATSGSVAVVRTGVGPVNAAHAVTLFLAQTGAKAIVVCGVGGAYPDSGLRVGDVVCADTECYGDLGATTPSGFLDMKALGFPVVETPTPLFNELPMQLFPVEQRLPFVTVTTCTGTDRDARAIEARTRGAVESMEGAAVAHVAHLHGIPVGEVRGISNIVTDRDTRTWRLKEAALAAQEAVLSWMTRS